MSAVPAANAPLPLPAAPAETRGFSPLARRRWANFKANRRGWWSLLIFLSIFTFTLFAELITRTLEQDLERRRHGAELTRRANLIAVLNRVGTWFEDRYILPDDNKVEVHSRE